MKRILGYLKDERGVETLEWIAVGALIVALAADRHQHGDRQHHHRPGRHRPDTVALSGIIT
jgi:hypothetical protein